MASLSRVGRCILVPKKTASGAKSFTIAGGSDASYAFLNCSITANASSLGPALDGAISPSRLNAANRLLMVAPQLWAQQILRLLRCDSVPRFCPHRPLYHNFADRPGCH